VVSTGGLAAGLLLLLCTLTISSYLDFTNYLECNLMTRLDT